MPLIDPKDSISQSNDELHVGLDIPTHTRREIHNWVKQQQWPEGTELEHPKDYHITMLYTPEGHEQHKDGWWIRHLDQTRAKVQDFHTFPAGDKGHPYVLKIDAPEIKERANELQNRALQHGLPITKFPGGYKPHLTIGYGPSEPTGIKPPNWEFDVGPSSVSPIRPAKEAAIKEAMPADPNWWATQEPLWHGTFLHNLPGVMSTGILPWDDPDHPHGTYWGAGMQATNDYSPRPNHVYLSNDLNKAYDAVRNVDMYEPAVLFKVDPTKLDPRNINPDEDYLEKDWGWGDTSVADKYPQYKEWKQEGPPQGGRSRSLGDVAEEIGLGDEPHETQRGIETHGTLAHRGRIPPEALTPHIQDRNNNWVPLPERDWGATSLEDLEHHYAVAPPKPPQYDSEGGTPQEHCGNCRMFYQGECWGFGNYEVNKDTGWCKEWYPAHGKKSAYNPDELKVLDHLSITNVAANLHYKFEEGGMDALAATQYAKKMLKLIGYPQDDITVQAALQAWQTIYPQDKVIADPAISGDNLGEVATTPTESWGYGTTSYKENPTVKDPSYFARIDRALKYVPDENKWYDRYADLALGRTSMAADPYWLDNWMERHGPYVYHSTPDPQGVLDRGILPWDTSGMGSKYKDELTPRPNHVYLQSPLDTVDPEFTHNPNRVRVDLRKLDPKNLNPDEDQLADEQSMDMWNLGEGPFWSNNPFKGTWGEWAEANNLHRPSQTAWSLENGTMAHHGPIPPEAIDYPYGQQKVGQKTAVHYRVDPTTERDRIRQHGFQPMSPAQSGNWDSHNWNPPVGVYMFDNDLEKAKRYRSILEFKRGVPHDIWAINPPEELLRRDPDMGTPANYLNQVVYPSHLEEGPEHRDDMPEYMGIEYVLPTDPYQRGPYPLAEGEGRGRPYPQNDPQLWDQRVALWSPLKSLPIVQKLYDQAPEMWNSELAQKSVEEHIRELIEEEEQHSTIPSEVNNPEDHIPEFGGTPPDKNRGVQFGNDWVHTY